MEFYVKTSNAMLSLLQNYPVSSTNSCFLLFYLLLFAFARGIIGNLSLAVIVVAFIACCGLAASLANLAGNCYKCRYGEDTFCLFVLSCWSRTRRTPLRTCVNNYASIILSLWSLVLTFASFLFAVLLLILKSFLPLAVTDVDCVGLLNGGDDYDIEFSEKCKEDDKDDGGKAALADNLFYITI